MDYAIDKDNKAINWLIKYGFYLEVQFANCCNMDKEATDWLIRNNYKVFVRLAEKINQFRDSMIYNPQKLHF